MQVTNCDQLSKPRLVKPNLSTTEPVCAGGQLQCGDGECLAQVEGGVQGTVHTKP